MQLVSLHVDNKMMTCHLATVTSDGEALTVGLCTS
jgi:hypothetical protein